MTISMQQPSSPNGSDSRGHSTRRPAVSTWPPSSRPWEACTASSMRRKRHHALPPGLTHLVPLALISDQVTILTLPDDVSDEHPGAQPLDTHPTAAWRGGPRWMPATPARRVRRSTRYASSAMGSHGHQNTVDVRSSPVPPGVPTKSPSSALNRRSQHLVGRAVKGTALRILTTSCEFAQNGRRIRDT